MGIVVVVYIFWLIKKDMSKIQHQWISYRRLSLLLIIFLLYGLLHDIVYQRFFYLVAGLAAGARFNELKSKASMKLESY